MRKLFIVMALMALVVPSCTGRRSERSSSEPSPSTSAVTTTVDEHDEAEEERHRRERLTLGYSPKKPPPKGFVPATKQSPPSGHLTMAVQFAPVCVEQGESVLLTAKTNRPGVRVSFITTLEDDEGRAVEDDGTTDSKGLWTWEFKVKENSPPHTYEMLGAAIDEERTGEGNSVLGSWHFVVAEPGQCA